MYISDSGSTNGTYVNNISIEKCRLVPGDQLNFGDSNIQFYYLGWWAEVEEDRQCKKSDSQNINGSKHNERQNFSKEEREIEREVKEYESIPDNAETIFDFNLKILKKNDPQIDMNGFRNTWIAKPNCKKFINNFIKDKTKYL